MLQQFDQPNLRVSPPVTGQTNRLVSLDVFRGIVILSMLIVNNLGDYGTTGYFWKHAGFVPPTEGYQSVQLGAFSEWWRNICQSDAPITTAFIQFPPFRHCTLADFVMPSFMLIIGLAIPFSAAASAARGETVHWKWLRIIRRAVTLVLLGWILCFFRDQFAIWWRDETGTVQFRINCGMDVLQLLGISYLVARLLYELPTRPRIVAAGCLFLWHWAVLRFWPQGDVARGTFTHAHNAISHIYSQDWFVWRPFEPVSWLSVSWKGLMSVPPATATMMAGTVMGDWLRRERIDPHRKIGGLALASALVAVIGLIWAFDLPFNKDRWTPCYLLWCTGIGGILLALIFLIVDIHCIRGWTYPLVVLGGNAIAAYFITILAKVLLLNTPRIDFASSAAVKLVAISMCAVITLIVAWAALQLTRATLRQLGAIGYGVPLVMALIPLTVWLRVGLGGEFPATQPTWMNLSEATILILKRALGAWEGGWMFTLAFALFWCLVLEAAYRRRIFWKL